MLGGSILHTLHPRCSGGRMRLSHRLSSSGASPRLRTQSQHASSEPKSACVSASVPVPRSSVSVSASCVAGDGRVCVVTVLARTVSGASELGKRRVAREISPAPHRGETSVFGPASGRNDDIDRPRRRTSGLSSYVLGCTLSVRSAIS